MLLAIKTSAAIYSFLFPIGWCWLGEESEQNMLIHKNVYTKICRKHRRHVNLKHNETQEQNKCTGKNEGGAAPRDLLQLTAKNIKAYIQKNKYAAKIRTLFFCV